MVLGILFLYAAIATFFPNAAFVGSLGRKLGQANLHVFGYLAYVNFLILLVPLTRWLRRRGAGGFDAEAFFAWLLLGCSMIILQALLVAVSHRGWIGSALYDFLLPKIGLVGIWLFWLLTFALSAVLLWGREALDRWETRKERLHISPDDASDDFLKIEVPSLEASDSPFVALPEREAKRADLKPIDFDETPRSAEAPKAEKKENAEQDKEASGGNTLAASNVEIVHELEENQKLLDQIDRGESVKPKDFKLPKIDFLQKPPKKRNEVNESEIDQNIGNLLEKLQKFNIEGDVVRTYAGPVVTTFEFRPASHVKVSKILNLQDDLAMALRAPTIRIQAPVPGKDVVGIEIPNKEVQTIFLREILDDDLFKKSKSELTIALGKDIVGKPFITDLKKLPHLLIAGTTGSGKSVGINAMILSLLYKNSPDHLKVMMIDPKMLEFSIYNDIPHLLTPVITQAKKAIVALGNMVGEMERRYQLMSQSRTKNIETYNEKAKREKREMLPYIVVVIDELADLMMTGGKDVEFGIARLAQMARASGIHLIVATQRPSVDVVTGLIKANLPSRISYKVGQKIDSKVILDTMGAESLLGRGDMLFTPPGGSGLIRLHAPWSSETEIETVVEFLKVQRSAAYDERFLHESESSGTDESGTIGTDTLDPLYEDAKQVVLQDRKSSISYIQRRLQIGYNRSARIVEQLEQMGVLSAPNAKGNREIIGS